ncbi:hypothetical protein ABH922_003036 [Rhodococcus sp. 27YEA15]|uniref:hypothetical protein n=1 Tax=Rhodococcus sp. 27YEA15 TaxID=3156259 RepID=UPI003C7A9C48
MTDFNPVAVEQGIRDCANNIAKGVTICANAYSAYLDADRMYDREYARAYMCHSGPAHEKKYAAEIATGEARAIRDEKDAAYRYSDRQAKALESELRAWQSLGASVRSAYNVAGRGEGA